MLKKAVRWSVVAALVITLFAAFSSLSAAIFLSNAPFPATGGPCVGNNGGLNTAVGFTTGGADTTLGYVSTLWHEFGNGIPMTLSLYSDNAGLPGTNLHTLGTQNTTGGDIYNTYTYPGGNFTLKANTTYWVVASTTSADFCSVGWGSNPTTPTGTFTYVGTKQYVGSWMDRSPVSIEIGEGSPTTYAPGEDIQFEPGDGRLNHATVDRAAPVAAYCLPHGIQIRIIDPATGIGIDPPAINIFNEEIEAAGIPTGENLLLAENNGVSLYRLTTGEFQVNVLNANSLEYKWFVFVWDQCPVPNSSYHLELKG